MKKYLREIEVSGLILTAIGVGLSWIMSYQYGIWPCGVGLLLLLLIFLYKAFHWKEYERENKQYIIIIIICIFLLILQMIKIR
jgi:O-antigen/teichoic acid export membrane protein